MDSLCTMYFDESGNNRCFWIKNGKFNVDPYTHFVLGGLVANNIVDFEYAKNKLECNATVREIKTRNVYKGGFEDCLRSKRVEDFFNLIIEKGWYVHFACVELFYYAIVDIVDSVMRVDVDIYQVKNELYRILRHDLNCTLMIMMQYQYPNVADKDKNALLHSLIKMIDNYIIDKGNANLFTYKLRLFFQLATEKDNLPLIQDNDSFNLIHDYTQFYIRPIYMFKNSQLIFDEELNVQEAIQSYHMTLDGGDLQNYQFVNSKDNVMVQLSDVFVGIIARYLRFINTNLYSIDEAIAKFDSAQMESFIKLNHILNISVQENSAFWDMSLCEDMRRIFSFIVEKYR